MGRGAGNTHPGHQRALQEELHELRDSQVHAEAAPAGSAPRGTKRLWQGAAGAGLRRLAPGRQRRGASPRSAASAAPRPARGWGRGGPAARGGTMRAAAPPPLGGPRLPARRLAVPGPGDSERSGLRRAPGGGGAARLWGRVARTWVHRCAPTAGAASALSGPQHVALPSARASAARPPRQVRTGARGPCSPPVPA